MKRLIWKENYKVIKMKRNERIKMVEYETILILSFQ